MSLYLITGGCGFIGSHLAEALLAAGHDVRILDDMSTGKPANKPKRAVLQEGSVFDPYAVAAAMRDVDGCFHLAALASVQLTLHDWVGTHRTNLTGSIVVFDQARRRSPPIPVVYASSAAVYGDNQALPLEETAVTRPLSAYGADKLGSEQHARVASQVHRVPTCGLRFFNVFGPRQDAASPYSGVISTFCDRLLKGQSVTVFGDGHQIRDFIYVSDVVQALIRAMDRASLDMNVFNICTGQGISVLELLRTINAILGVDREPTFAPARPGEIRVSIGDPTLARAALGFDASVHIRTGLGALLNK